MGKTNRKAACEDHKTRDTDSILVGLRRRETGSGNPRSAAAVAVSSALGSHSQAGSTAQSRERRSKSHSHSPWAPAEGGRTGLELCGFGGHSELLLSGSYAGRWPYYSLPGLWRKAAAPPLEIQPHPVGH
uniref:Uncharacterized protein n=1 Tax=Molossus molossus TaxID=27622 RepID=A0A7J8GRK5_MOLMO|nr:hypothetical protein HJG59_011243 [Molossus molossus]